MATIDTIINEQRALIDSVLTTARETTSRISSAGYPSLANPSLSYTYHDPHLTPPPAFGDVLPGDTSAATIQFLNTNIDAVVAKYMPELNACFRDEPEKWCCGIITGATPLGLSQAEFDLAWHQGRDREYRTRDTEVNQITQRFSAAGFSLPPGPMLAAITRSERRASDAIGDVNRAQTIKDIDLKWEMLKFAMTEAVQLKLGLLRIVGDLYNQFLLIPNRDVDLYRAKAQAYAATQNALASYYQVELGFEELRLRAEESRTGIKIDVDRNKIAASQGTNASSALAQAARGFTDTASAAANAQSALIADLTGGA